VAREDAVTFRPACRRLRAALVDAAAGTLPATDRGRVEAHVAGCARCRTTLAAMRRLAAEVPSVAMPDDAFFARQRAAVMRRVRTARPEPAPVGSWNAWRIAGAVATAALVLVLVRPRPPVSHSIDHLDDDALAHLHELLPAITPASTIEDADSDLLAIHDLGDDELDSLSDILGDHS
jgi:anti-sigma factor RsiW